MNLSTHKWSLQASRREIRRYNSILQKINEIPSCFDLLLTPPINIARYVPRRSASHKCAFSKICDGIFAQSWSLKCWQNSLICHHIIFPPVAYFCYSYLKMSRMFAEPSLASNGFQAMAPMTHGTQKINRVETNDQSEPSFVSWLHLTHDWVEIFNNHSSFDQIAGELKAHLRLPKHYSWKFPIRNFLWLHRNSKLVLKVIRRWIDFINVTFAIFIG